MTPSGREFPPLNFNDPAEESSRQGADPASLLA